MRIKILRAPTAASIDGIRLDRFTPGLQYEVGSSLATLFLAEGWAEPAGFDEPALVVPLSESPHDSERKPQNLIRDALPSYFSDPPAVAADRPRRSRRSRRR